MSIESKTIKIIAITLGGVLVAVLIFAAGVGVGFRKAKYSYQWGENYERNFMGPHMMGPLGFFHDIDGRDFRNGHGLAGSIISITDNNIVVKDRDNKENTVAITDKTIIKRGPDTIKITDLKTGDRIVVMGKPSDNGTVNADLIRVFPAMPPIGNPAPNDNSSPNATNNPTTDSNSTNSNNSNNAN